jgi:hypothetical protein
MPTARTDDHPVADINPTIRYRLMVGTWPSARTRGWVAALQALADGAALMAQAWTAYGDLLIEDAHAFQFEPFYVTRKMPRGAGVSQWTATFLEKYRY